MVIPSVDKQPLDRNATKSVSLMPLLPNAAKESKSQAGDWPLQEGHDGGLGTHPTHRGKRKQHKYHVYCNSTY